MTDQREALAARGAPKRIWAKSDRGFDSVAGTWLDESDGPDMQPYILATPAALAASPEVQALIAAELWRIEMAWRSTPAFDAARRALQHQITAIEHRAALRGEKEPK